MTIHGILSCIEGNIIFGEVEEIEKLDLENGYVKPKPVVRIYRKKYYPPKDKEVGRAAPMTGRGGFIYKERYR